MNIHFKGFLFVEFRVFFTINDIFALFETSLKFTFQTHFHRTGQYKLNTSMLKNSK